MLHWQTQIVVLFANIRFSSAYKGKPQRVVLFANIRFSSAYTGKPQIVVLFANIRFSSVTLANSDSSVVCKH